MKKLLILLAFAGSGAMAQTVTQQQLQGKWQLAYFDGDGITLDFDKKVVTLSKELVGMYPAEDTVKMKTQMQEEVNKPSVITMNFSGSTLVYNGDEGLTSTSVFTLTPKDGKTLMDIKSEEGRDLSFEVALKEGRMHLRNAGEEPVFFIYKKMP
jgi:hypothetical protein